MRPAKEIKDEVGRIARQLEEAEGRVEELRFFLAELFKQARDHPKLTIEEVRHIPRDVFSRQYVYELIRKADTCETPSSGE